MSDTIKTVFTCEHERLGCPYCAEKVVELTARVEKLRTALSLCDIRCGSLHHTANDKHSGWHTCPVEERIFNSLRGER